MAGEMTNIQWRFVKKKERFGREEDEVDGKEEVSENRREEQGKK